MSIPHDQFVPYASDVVGEEVNVHHCKQGRNNDRMYIRRTENGTILAYCHHCGEHGFTREIIPIFNESGNAGTGVGAVLSARSVLHGPSTPSSDRRTPFCVPKDTNFNCSTWDKECIIPQLSVNDVEASGIGVCYSPYSPGEDILCWVYPYYLNGSLVMYQLRHCTGEKWIRTWIDKSSHYDSKNVVVDPFTYGRTSAHSTLTIVEDYLSAVRVGAFTDSLALRGINLNNKQLKHILDIYDKYIIMLDNDNQQVRLAQTNLLTRFRSFGKEAVISYVDKDPKDYSTSGITAQVGEALCYLS
jgi:hypothetical protein